MKLTNDFQVGVPADRVWNTLLDVPRVARALPGAEIESDGADGAWRGKIKIKLGPVTTEYAGTAQVQDADEDERVASYRVEGREARGQGTAAATITTRLEDRGASTRVVVETDMQVTGRQAQLGHGMMEEVAGAVLGDFANRLERELSGESGATEGPSPGDALDVTAAVRRPLLRRAGLVCAGAVVGLVAGLVLGRRGGLR
jgi:uncharacterized protein